MKKLYVGCSLSNLPANEKEKFLSCILNLKKKLKEHFEVLEFLGTTGSPSEVYQRDIIECVYKADYMLAVCDHASTGLGYELGIAIEKRNIPVLAVAHFESNISKLVIGIKNENYFFIRYQSIEEIASKAVDFFKSFENKTAQL